MAGLIKSCFISLLTITLASCAVSKVEREQNNNSSGNNNNDDTTSVESSLNITAPNNGVDWITNNTDATVSGTCSSDITEISTSIGELETNDCKVNGTWSLKLYALIEGDNTFSISGKGADGNEVKDSLKITYDKIAPSIAITTPNNGLDFLAATSSQTISGTCGEDVASITSSTGSSVTNNCKALSTWSTTITLTEKDTLITLTAYDVAGNDADASINATYYMPGIHSLTHGLDIRIVNEFAENDSYSPAFSQDGTKMLFVSSSTVLVSGIDSNYDNVFLKDLNTGAISLVSTDPVNGATQDCGTADVPSFSPDGTKVAFSSCSSSFPSGDGATYHVYIKDLNTGSLILVSMDPENGPGDGPSYNVKFSPIDNTKILFISQATNFPGSNGDSTGQVYIKDLVSGSLTLISKNSDGETSTGNSLFAKFSPDGTKISFEATNALNLPGGSNDIQIYIKNSDGEGLTTLVSSTEAGIPANQAASNHEFSADGTKIVFNTYANNFPDANGFYQIYAKNVTGEGAPILVSTSAEGAVGDSDSTYPSFHPDGRIAFVSYASNLTGYSDGVAQTYLKDLSSGTITLISTTSEDEPGNGESTKAVFSQDGTKFGFYSSATNFVSGSPGTFQVFVKTISNGNVNLVSGFENVEKPFSATSFRASFSPDGTKILFETTASNLIPNDVNMASDILIKDLITGEFTLVSSNDSGEQGDYSSAGASFSSDGTKVLFQSYAQNFGYSISSLVYNVYIKNLVNGAVTLVSQTASGEAGTGSSGGPAVFSSDNTKVVFASNATNFPGANGKTQIYVKNANGEGDPILISKNEAGSTSDNNCASPDFSSDSTKIVFQCIASNFPGANGKAQIYIKNSNGEGAPILISKDGSALPGNQPSTTPIFSPDGTRILFYSSASTFPGANGKNQVYTTNSDGSGNMVLISKNESGTTGNNNSSSASYSPDGTKIIFGSLSSNFSNSNGIVQLYIKDSNGEGTPLHISKNKDGDPANKACSYGTISPDGTKVLFNTAAAMVPEDTNAQVDIFLYAL